MSLVFVCCSNGPEPIALNWSGSNFCERLGVPLAPLEGAPGKPGQASWTEVTDRALPTLYGLTASFGDVNGDGLMDLVTLDGFRRQAVLFVQERGPDQSLRLRRQQTLELSDGRPLDDRVVQRGVHWTESFRAVDWNRDGLQDLIYSVAGSHHGTLEGGSIYLLRNCGTRTHAVFASPQTLRCFGEPIRITNHGPHPWPGDFNGDGAPDLIACVEWSVYPYYCHAALMMPKRPEYTLELLR